MRLKCHEYELLLSISLKLYRSDDFQNYEAEFISHLWRECEKNENIIKRNQ